MDLTFNKVGDVYVAEFEVTQNFNLHLERENPSDFIQVYQNTGGEAGYAVVEDFPHDERYNPAIDYDFTAEIWPKRLRIVSHDEVKVAQLTTAGEVTEIKSQTKEIEVTANGTTEVTPDAGFAYLNSVKVKTNVPTSGEGGGGSASSWRYFDVSKLDSSMKPMTMPFIVKVVEGNDKKIVSPSIISDWTAVTAFGVDDSPKLFWPNAGIISWSQAQSAEGLTPEVMAQVGIVEITEEEFYNLNA